MDSEELFQPWAELSDVRVAQRDRDAALLSSFRGGEHLTREEHAADAPRWAHFLRPPPPRLAALDDDGAEPFLFLYASFRQSYTNWIVMHSSNQCDISFAVYVA